MKYDTNKNNNMNTEVNIKIQKLLLNLEVDMPVKTTISDVIMWIYEKHGIWIHATMSFKEFTPYIQCDWNYKQEAIKEVLEFMQKRFNSPTEAYLAAIEYTIKNLL